MVRKPEVGFEIITMIFKNLRFENFKSFVGKHEFDFLGSAPGLYFITGENKIDASLGSNGSGKSTLIDAIKWVISGKTVRNLKAGDVHSRNVKGGTSAELTLELNDSTYKIYRAWSPNKLTIATNDGEPVTVTQNEVDKLISLNEDDLMNSIIYGQFNSSFLDLQPSQMLQVFTGILDLEYWTDKSEKASAQKTKLTTELYQHESKVSFLNGKVEQLERSLLDATSASEQFEANQEADLTRVETQYNQVVAELDAIEENPVVIDKSELTEINNKILELREVIEDVRRDETTISSELMVTEANISRLRTEQGKLQRLGGTCSVCRQGISGEHIDKEILSIGNELSVLQNRAKTQKDRKQVNLGELSEANSMLQELTRSYTNAEVKIRETERKQQEISRKRAVLEHNATTLESEFHRIQEKTNPFDDKIKEIQHEKDRSKEALAGLTGKMASITAIISGYEKWVKGFKDIRLLVIEQAITDLEIEVNNAISELGLDGWSVKFDIEKENKSGGISKGFSVLVYSPTNAQPVPWVAWSGGEGQRLRLAATAGLSALILSRRNVNPSVIFFDEPTKNLSGEGIDSLVSYLHNLSRTLGKQIYLVDHHVITSGEFDRTIKIVKDKNGSRIEGY